jgi:hypothetical protein
VVNTERRERPKANLIVTVQCCASAYLSFFFTDCLMSRWFVVTSSLSLEIQLTSFPDRLLNYTPQAAIVRLLTINSMNAYITSWVLYLSGGSEDPRLLLPAWISIAAVLIPPPPPPTKV